MLQELKLERDHPQCAAFSEVECTEHFYLRHLHVQEKQQSWWYT